MERGSEGLHQNLTPALNSTPGEAQARVRTSVRDWRISSEYTVETARSILVFGARDHVPVVLKVMKHRDEEWRAGEVLAAFNGGGAVRVYEHVPGAMLLERLDPALSLMSIAQRDDEEATAILADVIAQLSANVVIDGLPTVQQWGLAFDRYLESPRTSIDRDLVTKARQTYNELCGSQSRTRLLHGDLHHENVLYDRSRGWVAIDPKGVIGELEYEVGAALRNPCDFATPFLEQRFVDRVDAFVRRLDLDRQRVRAWAFSQAVLAAIWMIEDGELMAADRTWISFAGALAAEA